jgi:hypothetical protein
MTSAVTARMSPAESRRLAAALALAESATNPSTGERLAALGAVERLLAKRGLRLRDIVAEPAVDDEREQDPYDDGWSPPAQPPQWKRLVIWCITHPSAPAVLSAWERGFLASLAGFPSASTRQLKVLARIVRRLRGGRA